ncbi:MAG: CDP-diglyceride synthetase [Acidimicrobiales bacterium]|nr:CDP-diglyceride synthetase [Acidimicrobiales bacterium]
MDDQSRSRPDEKKTPDANEGVRLIGPDEAAEAIERGDVAPRRADDELRYGDRPPAPPAGPRPALRFPLDASADPTRIERPPVQPAPDPVTGPVELPHWTEPPTGEVPAVLIGDDSPLLGESEDDLDAWSSFATSTPRWRDADDDWGDDGFVEHLAGDSGEVRIGALGDDDAKPSHDEYFGFDDMEQRVEERTGETAPPAEPGPRWDVPDDDWNAAEQGEAGVAAPVAVDEWDDEDDWDDEDAPGGDEDHHDSGGYVYDDGPGADNGGRDMRQAALTGGLLLLGSLVTLALGSVFFAVFVTVVVAASAIEYFKVLRDVGWEAATLLGIGASAALPLAVYWHGAEAWGLVGFVIVAATFAWYLVGAGGPDPRVLEGTGATLLGIAWIGGLGSAATALARMPDGRALLVVVILATAAHDVVALLGGKSFGHRPLSTASPNKTLEGLLAGMVAAMFVVIVGVGVIQVGPYQGAKAGLILGLAVALAAPLGDLSESILKRDLGVKDMGSILPGHGGLLDRFDGFLFVFPIVFWLAVTVGHAVA